jgi:predicted short-subunit dehydrogenase-like oxidoreductase (DUF2520 family)
VIHRVFVLGAGRAGQSLARALVAAGVSVVGLHGRRAVAGARRVSAGPLPKALADADTILLTVRDVQLPDAIREVNAATLAPHAVVLHASGASEPAELALLRDRGYACGTMHPLVPLSDPERAVELLRGAWIGVDGDVPAVARAESLALGIGARALHIPPGEKARYHAAAVFAANFPVVLSALAERLLHDAGVAEGEARGAVHHLMAAAVQNLGDQLPAAALTGPIVRGDVASVRRHLDVLAGDTALLESYVVISRAALALAAEQGTPAARLAEIDAALTAAIALAAKA